MTDKDLWPVMKRKEAAEAKIKKYWTGKPCHVGHISRRFTSTGVCCSCASGYSNGYQKKIRAMQHDLLREVTLGVHPDDVPALKAYAKALQQARALSK